jgi:hypothetical protein
VKMHGLSEGSGYVQRHRATRDVKKSAACFSPGEDDAATHGIMS